MQPFLPELMMQRDELIKAKRMLQKLDRIHEQRSLDEVLPKAEQKGWDVFQKKASAVRAEIGALAADVWKREVELGRFSVVHVNRGDMETYLQLLSFSFTDDFGSSGRWAWELRGRALRKNGTLGFKSTFTMFRVADIRRRHLDGVWRELSWLGRGRTNAFASG